MTTLIDIRHPEKRNKPDSPVLRKPPWIRVPAPSGERYNATRSVLRAAGLNTVCEEAGCPNIAECWNNKHATIMILGDICTRACAFCNVRTGKPAPPDASEPERVARTVAAMDLDHVVITSVDRDDLGDGGAAHFVAVIAAIREAVPRTTVEILTPDFRRRPGAIEAVTDAGPDVFNHNLETVPRLYGPIRPGARYFHSLRLLQMVRERDPQVFTKSGLMVGLGETREEILQVMDDMRCAGVDFITIGQYLQPTRKHAPVERYWTPQEFTALKRIALAKGFLRAAASPLTRSSYHAGEDFAALQAVRRATANAL